MNKNDTLEKSTIKKSIAFTIVIIIVIAGVGLALFFLFRNTEKKDVILEQKNISEIAGYGITLSEKDSKLYKDEAFGPVMILEAYDDFDKGIELANDSRFGLQVGVYSSSINKAMQAWDSIEAGGVIINDVPTFRVDNMPYGGVKDSGFGREGVKYAIEDMTEVRLMVVKD